MKARKNTPASPVRLRRAEESATNIRRHAKGDVGTFCPAVPSRRKLNYAASCPAQKPAPSSRNIQSTLEEYSRVLKRSLRPPGRSVFSVPRPGNATFGDLSSNLPGVRGVSKCKRARRVYQREAIAENRFQAEHPGALRDESSHLKRDTAHKRGQRKSLAAKLDGAEDVEKTKVRPQAENISMLPRQRSFGLAMLSLNYNTEKKIQELEQRLQAGQRDNLKFFHYVQQYSAETECFKKRLEEMSEEMSEAGKRPCSCCYSSTKCHNKVSTPGLEGRRRKRCNRALAQSEEMGTIGVHLPTEKGCQWKSNAVKNPLFTETVIEQGWEEKTSMFDMKDELVETREKLKLLTVRHKKALEELQSVKSCQERSIQELQATYRDLNEERRKCLKLEATEKSLSLELKAAKYMEVLLQQVRQQNLQLEIENAELVASALNVPRTNFSDMKILREQLVNALKEQKFAEANFVKADTQAKELQESNKILRMQIDKQVFLS